MKRLLPCLLVARAAPVLAGEPSPLVFKHVIVDAKPPSSPWIKIVADLDGNGKPDIIIGGARGPLVWYRNPGWTKLPIAAGGYSTVGGAAADIDRDGDLDIALGGVVWFENPRPKGDPAQGTWAAHQVEKRPGHDLLASDLDGDGQADLVMRDQSAFGSQGGRSIFIYRQNNPAAWTMREVRCPDGEGVHVADVNGDGRPDIVTGGFWFENDGDILKGAWAERAFTTEWNYAHTKVASGDLNGDGRPDIILSPAELKGGTHRIAWYAAPPAGRAGPWRQRIVEEPVETVIHALAVADFNRDGQMDIVSARMHQGKPPQELVVHLNTGRGRGWSRQVVSTRGSHDVVAADIDGNGRPDILGANHAGPYQPVELWLNVEAAP